MVGRGRVKWRFEGTAARQSLAFWDVIQASIAFPFLFRLIWIDAGNIIISIYVWRIWNSNWSLNLGYRRGLLISLGVPGPTVRMRKWKRRPPSTWRAQADAVCLCPKRNEPLAHRLSGENNFFLFRKWEKGQIFTRGQALVRPSLSPKCTNAQSNISFFMMSAGLHRASGGGGASEERQKSNYHEAHVPLVTILPVDVNRVGIACTRHQLSVSMRWAGQNWCNIASCYWRRKFPSKAVRTHLAQLGNFPTTTKNRNNDSQQNLIRTSDGVARAQ